MGSPSAGAIVLVHFPFSDLSASKLRPAVVLASAGGRDLILCQITSNAYSDPKAMPVESAHFESGGLQRTSYARPGKLFTANDSLIVREAGRLKPDFHKRIIGAVVSLLQAAL